MEVSFLYPLLWLGTVAVAAPIWLHLRRRTDPRVFRFSALRFLDDQPAPQRSPLRLRDLLLLALRAAAVLLLCAAFAWPYWNKPPDAAPTESRVYILDNTLSHQAGDRFAQARQRLLDEIAAAGSDTQVAVVELTAQPRAVVSFGDGREFAAEKVRDLEPSFERGPYLAAFRLANTLLAQALGQRKRIIFCSDQQQNQWQENVSVPPFLEHEEVELRGAMDEPAANAALAAPRWSRTHVGDRAVVDVAVELYHQGELQSATVTLRVNDVEILRREIDLAGQPESITLVGRWEADPGQWLRGEILVEAQPDALPGDDRVFFAIPAVREGQVLLLAQSPYLRAALSPEVMRGRWATRVVEPADIAAEATATSEADVLCVETSYLQSDRARDLVLRYLNQGRGVLMLVNRVTPLVAGFVRELGFEVQPAARDRAPTAFRYVFGDHPIFQPFRSPDFGNLLDVRVERAQRLRVVQGVPLVFSQSGDPLFVHGAGTRGKLFVAAFGFDRSDTNWPLHPTFVPFLDLCLRAARAEDTMPTGFEPGELCVLHLPGDAAAREVVIRDGDRELARAAVAGDRVQFPAPRQPGLYTLACGPDSAEDKLFAVNPSPLESRLGSVAEPAALDTWRVRSGEAESRAESVVAAEDLLSRANILSQRAWWWLLVAGLAALAGEMALAAKYQARAGAKSEARTPESGRAESAGPA